MDRPLLTALDLEGVLVPEVWIALAERTGIEELRLTTRDVADYDALMVGRLSLLREHGLTLGDIQTVIAGLTPLEGAVELLRWLRTDGQAIILSDTFYEFADPLMEKLGRPTLFCNWLDVDSTGVVVDYHIRVADGKRQAVRRLKELNFAVVAVGDSYNDTTMLAEADCGVLFRPSDNVRNEFPQFSVAETYPELRSLIEAFRAAP